MFPIACMVFVMNSLSAAVINYRQRVIILQHYYSVTLTKKQNKPKTKTAFIMDSTQESFSCCSYCMK